MLITPETSESSFPPPHPNSFRLHTCPQGASPEGWGRALPHASQGNATAGHRHGRAEPGRAEPSRLPAPRGGGSRLHAAPAYRDLPQGARRRRRYLDAMDDVELLCLTQHHGRHACHHRKTRLFRFRCPRAAATAATGNGRRHTRQKGRERGGAPRAGPA